MKHLTSRHLAPLALGGLLAFAGAASAAAADYYAVAAGDGYMMMVDKSSIYQTGGYSRGWVITLEDGSTVDDAPIVSVLLEVDCQQNQTRPISFTARDEDGNVTDSDSDVGEWSHVEPSTTGEDVRNAICSPDSLTEHELPSDSLTAIRKAYIDSLKE